MVSEAGYGTPLDMRLFDPGGGSQEEDTMEVLIPDNSSKGFPGRFDIAVEISCQQFCTARCFSAFSSRVFQLTSRLRAWEKKNELQGRAGVSMVP
jgi:hypothetical protein